jgi:PTH1 family peptidyl-tRNA hydrolase
MQSFLIVGLGNPGSEYKNTRHNIGFDVLDKFCEGKGIYFESSKYGDLAQTSIRGRKVYLLKPNTYMNLSGKAVRYHIQQNKISIENCLIITDDLSLPVGKIRIKKKGSDGGHNGLKSIQECLNTSEYPRLRFGIGNNFQKGKQVEFVLGTWNKDEVELISMGIEKSIGAIESFVTLDIEKTMTTFNAN